MTESLPKLFVLDTNVILHDCGCIRNFEENDIAIPITVLEELDQFKRGNEDINFQAREFLRRIDALTGDVLSTEGSPLGPGLGSIRVVLGGSADARLHESFLQDTPDHRILRATLSLQQQSAPRPVILVSKDTNLRMKAKSLGLRAQDYTSDKVQGFDTRYTGKRIIEGIDSEVINRLYAQGGRLPAADLPICRSTSRHGPTKISCSETAASQRSPPTGATMPRSSGLKNRPATASARGMPSSRSPSRP